MLEFKKFSEGGRVMELSSEREVLIKKVISEAMGTITHKTHGEVCTCTDRIWNTLNAIDLLLDIKLHGKVAGVCIRDALLPKSLELFQKTYPDADIRQLPKLAYVTQ